MWDASLVAAPPPYRSFAFAAVAALSLAIAAASLVYARRLSRYYSRLAAMGRTDRQRLQEQHAFVAEAAEVLASSLDLETTLANVARLAVPARADYVIITLGDPDTGTNDVAVVHRDPTKEETLRALIARDPRATDATRGVGAVMRSGMPQLFSHLTWAERAASARDAEHLRLLESLGTHSAIIVPLAARQATLGAITFGITVSGRYYTHDDLATAVELGRNAALAVDNARLFAAETVAHRAAETASRAKSQFLAVMSHELRTPLNAIIGYTDLLSDEIVGPLTPTQHAHLRRVRSSAHHLLGLIEQVLSMSRIDIGRERVVLETLDLRALARESAGVVEPAARHKGIQFSTAVPDEPVMIRSDPTKLRQIAINLLSNAVKFTDDGQVWFEVFPRADSVELVVRDTGIGIAPEHLDLIFEPFWQVEQSRTRRAGGTGLGLSVTRRLLQLLGGDVRVESNPGVGSTFVVSVPRTPAADAPSQLDRDVTDSSSIDVADA